MLCGVSKQCLSPQIPELISLAPYPSEPTPTLLMDFQKSLKAAEFSLRGVTEQEQTLTRRLQFHRGITDT